MNRQVIILLYSISFLLLFFGCTQQKDRLAEEKAKIKIVSGYAEVNGTKLYYELAGSGEAIVLIHGNFGDCRHWDDQFEAFAKNYKVLRYDVRGYGKSSLPIEGQTYRSYEDLNELLKYLDISKAHIAGWSMGCRIAVDFVLTYPEMSSSLIAVGPWVSGYKSQEMSTLFSKFTSILKESGKKAATEFLMSPVRDPKVADRLREICVDYSFWRFLHKNPERTINPPATQQLERIDLPTLIITAQDDSEPCREVADLMEKAIPNAKKVVITNASHQMLMEKPDEFNKAMIDFFNEIKNK